MPQTVQPSKINWLKILLIMAIVLAVAVVIGVCALLGWEAYRYFFLRTCGGVGGRC